MTSTLKVCYNKKQNLYYIRFTKRILKELKWKAGDRIAFIDNKDGSWTLKRV